MLFQAKDPSEPAAIWRVILLVGAVVLIGGCCQWTGSECHSDIDGESSDG
jgi:hypothetical protein